MRPGPVSRRARRCRTVRHLVVARFKLDERFCANDFFGMQRSVQRGFGQAHRGLFRIGDLNLATHAGKAKGAHAWHRTFNKFDV